MFQVIKAFATVAGRVAGVGHHALQNSVGTDIWQWLGSALRPQGAAEDDMLKGASFPKSSDNSHRLAAMQAAMRR